ncbi:regulatory protein GemA [Amphritea sp. 2_MG-2023]|uniref:gp16 family protein n=1 Tax=Amphritea TaxID=515417 RepID=UPI002090D08F|nr:MULTISPECIES: regulatory protein GemA [Amphritea]MDO6419368.1 regulatory protein GemA [Amphritea sp. 2_MG-2023]
MPKDPRKAAIVQIHIAKKQLGLDDETYRQMLAVLTGKNSCAQMTINELKWVISHLKKCGFKNKPQTYGQRPNPGASRRALMNKVEALLADNGLHWNYAHSMAAHMFKVEKVDWLDPHQLHKLVAALEINARRQAAKQRASTDE